MSDLALLALTRLNIVVASATALFAFSLAVYLFVYNVRDAVARAFVFLLAFVTVVYVGDVFLATARLSPAHPASTFWLRFEWLGIAFVVPAYLHFGHALLATTGDRSARRAAGIVAAYALGGATLVGVLVGDAIVDGAVGVPGAVRLRPGPLFPGFALGFAAVTAWAAWCVWRARARTLTHRSHRRMTYLLVSVIAPLSTFPYLLAGAAPLAAKPALFQSLAAVANVAIATMLVFVTWAVAYHGALTPDRAVKREFLKFIIHGPTLGVFVIAAIQLVPGRLHASLGLPRDVVFSLTVVVGIVVYQLIVRALRPAVDFLLFGARSREVMWLRRLDERLLTAEDLAHLLENILAAMCDRARVRAGSVLVMNGDRLEVDVRIGAEARTIALLDALGEQGIGELATGGEPAAVTGFRVWPLHPSEGETTLGLLAIDDPGAALPEEEEAAIAALVASAERALEDRLVQQRVIASVRALEPEIAGLQRLRGALEPGGEGVRAAGAPGLVHDPDFRHWVRDALGHYWGGPKLTESPLLGLRVVREALEGHDYNPARAMRAVLDQAIERLRPEGERSSTASQWVIYNILELKFVRGHKVRDIAQRMAMSESDLYRKQRVALEALSRQLAAMEVEPGTTGIEPDGRQGTTAAEP